jgi:hypothetical protein
VRSRSDQTPPAPPPLTGQIHYLIGGLLPPSQLEWVRQDLTGPGWRHRQARRLVLLMLPFAIVFVVLPGSASVRVSIPLGLLLIAVVMGYATGDYFRNRRLDQYGIERPRSLEEDEYIDEFGEIREVGRPAQQPRVVSEDQPGGSPQQARAGTAETPEDDPDDE